MRDLVRPLLEAAGLTVLDEPTRIPVPPQGDGGDELAILGQLQSLDSDGTTFAYYFRPAEAKPPIPRWLSTLSRVSYDLEPSPRIFLVVEETSDGLEADAVACGAGVLLLDREQSQIEVFVAPSPPGDELTAGEFERRVQAVRTRIVSRATLEQRRIQEQYSQASQIAANAGPASAARLRELQAEHDAMEAWKVERERELAAAARARDLERVLAIEAQVGG